MSTSICFLLSCLSGLTLLSLGCQSSSSPPTSPATSIATNPRLQQLSPTLPDNIVTSNDVVNVFGIESSQGHIFVLYHVLRANSQTPELWEKFDTTEGLAKAIADRYPTSFVRFPTPPEAAVVAHKLCTVELPQQWRIRKLMSDK